MITSTTAAIVSIVTAVASAAAGAASARMSANAQQESAKFNAAVARNNALAASDQAEYEADRIRDRNRRLMAQQRTNIAASGFTLGGTGEDIMVDSATQGELDVMSALYSGQITVNNQAARAKLADLEGKHAKTAGWIGMGSSILTGASGVAGGITDYNAAKNPKVIK